MAGEAVGEVGGAVVVVGAAVGGVFEGAIGEDGAAAVDAAHGAEVVVGVVALGARRGIAPGDVAEVADVGAVQRAVAPYLFFRKRKGKAKRNHYEARRGAIKAESLCV